MKRTFNSRTLATFTFAVVASIAVAAEQLASGPLAYVPKAEYLDLMEAAVSSYSDMHILKYICKCEREGVQEHGFPRLASNIGVLIANGRMPEKRKKFCRMMSLCCRAAAKGKMFKEGNEFSVKELAIALAAVERVGIFGKDVMDAWRTDLSAVEAGRCYTMLPPVGAARAYNWCVFGCASEQARIALGMGGDAAHVEKYVADQLRWFDANGMYRDPYQPAVYDLVTRLQFMVILYYGYDGPSRAKLEEMLDRSAEPTLAMLSASGEIPYGGRSNQFLHNHTFYAAVCEWYAARYNARGDAKRAARFRRAARVAVDALKEWLAVRPVRHVKNLYPRGDGMQESGIGCEGYAYFDKYMVTMGSWAMLAHVFADESVPPLKDDRTVRAESFATTPDFHFVFLRAGEYSAQFDYDADKHYDCNGLGRIQHKGAPSTICISVPCTLKPNYVLEKPNKDSLAMVPKGDGKLVLDGYGHDADEAWANWKMDGLSWRCRLSATGLASTLTGKGEVAMKLPAFEFDGENKTDTDCIGKTLTIRYRDWLCIYETDGTLVDTGMVCCNRNGRYKAFEARGTNTVSVKVAIRKETACICGEAPERANDFFWENDRVGFRAYGPGDIHKWSGIDVFNKATAANFVARLLRRKGQYGNWHKNVRGLGMDDYSVGPGRGVGGVAFRKDGKWLADYGNWVAYRVLTNCDEHCAFELDYRLPFGGTMTLGIMLPRGSSFFEETVSFSEDTPLDGIEVGVGLDLNADREHVGDLLVDERLGIVSLFEKPHNRPGEEGSMMSAIRIKPGKVSFTMADEPNGAKLLMTGPLKASDAIGKPVLTVLAGADWTEAGRFRTADAWHSHVKKQLPGLLEKRCRCD